MDASKWGKLPVNTSDKFALSMAKEVTCTCKCTMPVHPVLYIYSIESTCISASTLSQYHTTIYVSHLVEGMGVQPERSGIIHC